MEASTSIEQGDFRGHPEHLERFLRLAATRMRSHERGDALREWSDYKKAVAKAYVIAARPRRLRDRPWTKDESMDSLVAPAIDLRGALLPRTSLGYVDLRGARLDGIGVRPAAADDPGAPAFFALKGARMQCASLRRATLPGVLLMEADLRSADLVGADLTGADLSGANLAGADLRGACLAGANLQRASVMNADLRGADLRGARVHGLATWDVRLCDDERLRRGLVLTPGGLPEVEVDNLDVAQFLYVLLTGARLGPAFDALGDKGVLILGRFTHERKLVLDALRDALRRKGFVPVIFDFDRPRHRDLTETVRLLAGISRFIIADITNPRSSPLELQATVPEHMIPLVPIIATGEEPFPMFRDLWVKHHQWVLDPLEYDSAEQLLSVLEPAVIEPALRIGRTIVRAKARRLRTRRAADFVGQPPPT
jgi:uncharacterized protein YjbI with pentapeptide repeats